MAFPADDAIARDLAVQAGERLLKLRAAQPADRDPEPADGAGPDARTSAADRLRRAGDLGSQDFLAAELARLRPADAVLSEEAADDPARLSASRVWIIDPLDGTREFGEPGRADWAVHVALWERGELTAGAVALPAQGKILSTAEPPARPGPIAPAGPIRLVVSRSRPPEFVQLLAEQVGAELVPLGSAGAKAAAVITGQADAYVHSGGQYEWDSAAPVAVARAAGLHTCRIDGSPLRYNQEQPWMPDILICTVPLADRLLGAIAAAAQRAGEDRPAWPAPVSHPTTRSPAMTVSRSDYQLSQLDVLQAESVHVMREVAAEFERPVLLFSGGKDSIVMLALAERAFWPARIPFPVMHIDTGHNFDEVLAFRDRRAAELGVRLLVASVQSSIDAGRVTEETGRWASRNKLQTITLLDAIAEHKFDAVFGGARRDEEKARAKERVFSFRDEFGQWDPKNQRPELWSLYNTKIHRGEHIRVFPLSNWTELDIWHYIDREQLEIPSIYFAHRRAVFERDGILLADHPYVSRAETEATFETMVRYRTVGDITCTGAVESSAATLAEVISEIAATRITERGQTRADDRASEAAMEDRKREGYF